MHIIKLGSLTISISQREHTSSPKAERTPYWTLLCVSGKDVKLYAFLARISPYVKDEG